VVVELTGTEEHAQDGFMDDEGVFPARLDGSGLCWNFKTRMSA